MKLQLLNFNLCKLTLCLFIFSCGNLREENIPSGNGNKEETIDFSTVKHSKQVSNFIEEDIEQDDFGENPDEIENTFDGNYCADVTYFNSNTGTNSEYRLIIEVEDNILMKINFPQGWLDEDEFEAQELNEDGFVEFETHQGYAYTVQILEIEIGDCFDGLIHPVQCIGITLKGGQCKHLTDNPNQLCWQHQNQDFKIHKNRLTDISIIDIPLEEGILNDNCIQINKSRIFKIVNLENTTFEKVFNSSIILFQETKLKELIQVQDCPPNGCKFNGQVRFDYEVLNYGNHYLSILQKCYSEAINCCNCGEIEFSVYNIDLFTENNVDFTVLLNSYYNISFIKDKISEFVNARFESHDGDYLPKNLNSIEDLQFGIENNNIILIINLYPGSRSSHGVYKVPLISLDNLKAGSE